MTKNFCRRAVVGLIALLMISGPAFAQKAKPKQALGGIQVLKGKWAKVCSAKGPGGQCMTTTDAFMKVKGIKKPVWLATAAVRVMTDTKTKTILFRVPLQVRLQEGMLIRIDNGNISRVEFEFCQNIGCWVVLPANDKLIDRFQDGKKAFLQFSDMRGKTLQVEISLAGFTKAYKGKPSKTLAKPRSVLAPAKVSKKGDAPAN